MRTVLLALILFCFCPYIARADTKPFPANCSVPVPDTSGWKTIQSSRIEFRLSDYAAAYLGLDIVYMEYRNPLNDREFVRVISQHIPLIPEQKKLNDRVISDVVTTLYTRKEEQDRLSELATRTDFVLFVQWRTKENPRTRQNQLDDDVGVNVWFHNFDGGCLVVKNEKVRTQFLTENIGEGKSINVFVGVQYSIEVRPEDTDENICSENKNENKNKDEKEDACKAKKFYHILKVNRSDILLLTNGEK